MRNLQIYENQALRLFESVRVYKNEVLKLRKIAIIGAGSIVFCKTLILDIMATKPLEDAHFVLMAPSTSRTSH